MADPVTDFLGSPDQFGATPKRPTLTLPKKGQPAASDDPTSAFLADPDTFKAPVQPTSTVSPEGGLADYLYGGLQGLYNTARGLITGAGGQAAGLADIPVHAAGTAAGLRVPEPQKIEEEVSDLGRATPSTRIGERTGQLVEEGLGDIMGAPGRAAATITQESRKQDLIEDLQRQGMSFYQAKAEAERRLQPLDPERQAMIENTVNSAAMLVGARGAMKGGEVPRGNTVESEGYEKPPPSTSDPEFQNIHGKPAYLPPESEPGEKRAPAGVQAEVRAAYDQLTPADREDTPIRDQLTGAFSPAIYKRLQGTDRPQVFIDLRGFKALQEPAGKPVSHGFGDELLKSLGDQAKSLGIPLFRTGGDEFAILGDREQAMQDARRLQEAMRGHTVRYTAKDGTTYSAEVSLDYGFGKNRDAADAAAQASKKANKAAGQAPGRDAGGVDRPAAAGRQARSGTAPDRSKVSRLLAGTNARLTPFKADKAPSDIQWNSVELESGLGDVKLPQRNLYASPADEFVQKLGESQYGHAIRGEKFRVDPKVLEQFRRYGQQGEFPWWQEGGKGMLANIAHAVDIASERRQTRQQAYRTLSDEVGTREMLRNAHDYALTFDWRKEDPKARPSEIVCGDL